MSDALHALVWLVSLIPRAESPLPETIDITSPFAMAGVGNLIGALVRPRATAATRDLLSRRWSLLGLTIGFALYGLVATYQLLSML